MGFVQTSRIPVESVNSSLKPVFWRYSMTTGLALVVCWVVSATSIGVPILYPGLLVTTSLLPGVGAHDLGFIVVFFPALILDALLYGALLLLLWRVWTIFRRA